MTRVVVDPAPRPMTRLVIATACVLWCLHLAVPAHAQVTPRDSASAVADARVAAREPILGGYFLVSAVTAPFALAGVIVATSGEPPRLWMAAGPAALSVIGTHASRSNLPLPQHLEHRLAGEDSMYVAVFRTTYDVTVRRRRQKATALGAFAGIIATVTFFTFAFEGGT